MFMYVHNTERLRSPLEFKAVIFTRKKLYLTKLRTKCLKMFFWKFQSSNCFRLYDLVGFKLRKKKLITFSSSKGPTIKTKRRIRILNTF